MTRKRIVLAIALPALLIAVVIPMLLWAQAGSGAEKCTKLNSNQASLALFQTSAALMIDYSKCQVLAASEEDAPEATKHHLLLVDIYNKAWSYAFLNKLFFWFSVAFGVMVLLWPSLSIIFKSKVQNWEWVKSATVQTTVTGLAALMFTFYSQYKDKQTYAETLMRHVIYSEQRTADLSTKVVEELARIDRGFSFSSILGQKGGKESSETNGSSP